MPLTESELRQVLLVRAIETAARDASDPEAAAPWTADDAQAVSAEARRQVGEQASFELFLAARARAALARLQARGAALAGPVSWLPWPAAWPVLGLGLGLLGERLSADGRIQLLSWPWLLLLGWNLLVVLAAVLGLLKGAWHVARFGRADRRADRRAGRPAGGASIAAAGAPDVAGGRGWASGHFAAAAPGLPWLLRWLPRLRAWWVERQGRAATGARGSEPGASWPVQAQARASRALWVATLPLQRQRALAWLHLAAAALVLGALASLYLRGLVLDFRAGWDSTFLGPDQVHRLLDVLLWPATQWAGWALPPVDALAQLRWTAAVGVAGGGAPAADWIHRLALSLGVMVLLPRLLLAALAGWQARRLAAALPLPDDTVGQAPYYQPLRRQAPAPLRPVCVLPYSYQVPIASQAGLAEAAVQTWGPGAQPHCVPSVPMGAEDNLGLHLPGSLPPDVVALMALTATPERETHGRFLQALQAQLPSGSRLHIWLDSSGFLQRLAGQPDAPVRLAQRQQAWAAVLSDLNLPVASTWCLSQLGQAEPGQAAQAAAQRAAHPAAPAAPAQAAPSP